MIILSQPYKILRGVDYMGKQKVATERVSMNLPISIIEKVNDYANSLGINVTSAYIVLLNQALDQKEALKQMPLLQTLLTEAQNLQKSIEEKEGGKKD